MSLLWKQLFKGHYHLDLFPQKYLSRIIKVSIQSYFQSKNKKMTEI